MCRYSYCLLCQCFCSGTWGWLWSAEWRVKEKLCPRARRVGILVGHLRDWDLRCAWTWPDFKGMQVRMVTGASQRIQDHSTSWRLTGAALPMSAWLHPLSPPPHQMATSRLQMGSAPRPQHCLGVSEPKQHQGRWGALNRSDGGSVLRPAPRSCFTDQCRHTLVCHGQCIFLPISLIRAVHRLKKAGTAVTTHGQTDIHTNAAVALMISHFTNQLSHTPGSLDATYPGISSHGMRYTCCQEKQLYPTRTLKAGSPVTPWTENNLIPPVGLHLLQGITGDHKTSVHLLHLLKPFLRHAATERSSHSYKISCRTSWQVKHRGGI